MCTAVERQGFWWSENLITVYLQIQNITTIEIHTKIMIFLLWQALTDCKRKHLQKYIFRLTAQCIAMAWFKAWSQLQHVLDCWKVAFFTILQFVHTFWRVQNLNISYEQLHFQRKNSKERRSQLVEKTARSYECLVNCHTMSLQVKILVQDTANDAGHRPKA